MCFKQNNVLDVTAWGGEIVDVNDPRLHEKTDISASSSPQSTRRWKGNEQMRNGNGIRLALVLQHNLELRVVQIKLAV